MSKAEKKRQVHSLIQVSLGAKVLQSQIMSFYGLEIVEK